MRRSKLRSMSWLQLLLQDQDQDQLGQRPREWGKSTPPASLINHDDAAKWAGFGGKPAGGILGKPGILGQVGLVSRLPSHPPNRPPPLPEEGNTRRGIVGLGHAGG